MVRCCLYPIHPCFKFLVSGTSNHFRQAHLQGFSNNVLSIASRCACGRCSNMRSGRPIDKCTVAWNGSEKILIFEAYLPVMRWEKPNKSVNKTPTNPTNRFLPVEWRSRSASTHSEIAARAARSIADGIIRNSRCARKSDGRGRDWGWGGHRHGPFRLHQHCN